MALTIQQVAQNLDNLAITEASSAAKNGMKFAQITCQGRPLSIRLSEELDSIRVPFPPSVYGGDGSEPRKSIVYAMGSQNSKIGAAKHSKTQTPKCNPSGAQ